MKTLVLTTLLLGAQIAPAWAHTDISVTFGAPAPVVVAPALLPASPPPQYYDPGEYVQPEVAFDAPPRFVYSPQQGCHVAADSPYDLVFLNGRYYLWSGGYWSVAPSYSGPWRMVQTRWLPPALRHYRHHEARWYRDHDYRGYDYRGYDYRGYDRHRDPYWQGRRW